MRNIEAALSEARARIASLRDENDRLSRENQELKSCNEELKEEKERLARKLQDAGENLNDVSEDADRFMNALSFIITYIKIGNSAGFIPNIDTLQIIRQAAHDALHADERDETDEIPF